MELWEQKFVGMFIFKKPVCQFEKTYKFLKAVHAKYKFTNFNKDVSWMVNVVEKVQLVLEDGQVVGESYLDGTGWFKYNMYPRGRGTYQKITQMKRLIEEHTNVVGTTEVGGERWHQDNILHFRMRPQNLTFLSSSKGFNDFVASKYATAGFKV